MLAALISPLLHRGTEFLLHNPLFLSVALQTAMYSEGCDVSECTTVEVEIFSWLSHTANARGSTGSGLCHFQFHIRQHSNMQPILQCFADCEYTVDNITRLSRAAGQGRPGCSSKACGTTRLV
jgi:hypothetical protein